MSSGILPSQEQAWDYWSRLFPDPDEREEAMRLYRDFWYSLSTEDRTTAC